MCAATPYPREKLYRSDLANGVCVEFEMYDFEQILFQRTGEFDLLVGGPCDGMFGYTPRAFKKIQNWSRDAIKEGKQ